MAADVEEYTYAWLGAALIGAIGLVLASLLRNVAKKASRDTDLDARLVTITDTMKKVYDGIIDEQRETIHSQRARMDQFMDSARRAEERYASLLGDQNKLVHEEVKRANDECRVAMADIYVQLEQCKSRDREHAARADQMDKSYTEVRQLITDTLGAIKPANVNVRVTNPAAPIAPVPVTIQDQPVATVSTGNGR